MNYNAALGRYIASKGQLMYIDDVTGEKVTIIDHEGAEQLRAASHVAVKMPQARFEPCGLTDFVLQPGERAVVPVKWEGHGGETVRHCSTHPLAPQGLAVLPGECDSKGSMSIVIENGVSDADCG